MVSVIVPVYKVEPYLRRCIDSILSQSYKNLEIILVDDGSPDNSGAICDEYAKKDSRIICIHKKNGGLSSARNAGLDIATGAYVSFIDSDDWVDKDFIEKLRTIVVEADAEMSACTFCRTKGNIAKRRQFNQEIKLITEKKYDCVFSEQSYAGYVCNKLFKREILVNNQLRFDENIFNGEDFPFVLEYLKHTRKIAFINQDLYYYFFRETGIMNNIHLNERFITILVAREKALEFLKNQKAKCYDKCKASYLSILCKIKYMSMIDSIKHQEILSSVNVKLLKERKGLFFLKHVGVKDKLKLFVMIYFPRTMTKIYRKKVKVL